MIRSDTKTTRWGEWIARACAALAVLLLAGVALRAQDKPAEKPYVPWVAPVDARAVKSPLKPTPDVLKAGAESFPGKLRGLPRAQGRWDGANGENAHDQAGQFHGCEIDVPGNRRIALLENE